MIHKMNVIPNELEKYMTFNINNKLYKNKITRSSIIKKFIAKS